MSKLEELIQQYCPDGVEWKTLGEVCDIHKGVQFNKTDMKEVGTYPVINGGINPSGYAEVFNEGKNTITISQGGASAGYVNFLRNKFWLGAHCYAVIPYDTVLNKYLYHFIKMNEITLQQCQYGAGIPALAKSTISSLEIPVPPLPVQEEIVRILDAFTELQAELQAELQKRKQQYNYYRDNLLAFEDKKDIQWKHLGDICDIKGRIGFRGYTREDQVKEGEGALSLSPSNIQDGQMDYSKGTYITWSKYDESPEIKTYNGDIIFCKTASVGKVAVVKNLPYKATINPQLVVLKNIQCSASFLAYVLETNSIQSKVISMAGVGSVPNISQKALSDIYIPIPSLYEQQRLVDILDMFNALANDLAAGLPAEIEKRRLQYEYYRDKLLTFKRKGA